MLQHSLFIEINQYLAKKNEYIATQVTGADRVRYLQEYLYHTAQSQDTPTVEAALISTLQQIKGTSPDAIMQFTEEISQDEELIEVLEKHHKNVYEYIDQQLAKEE